MRLYQAVGILARRLGAKPGRVQAIAGRLQEANLLSKCEGSRRFPIEIGEPEIVRLFIATIAESGIGSARDTVGNFGGLRDHADRRLDAVFGDLLFGPPRHVAHLIVRQAPAGVGIIVDGEHIQFGADPPESGATAARIVPGASLSAIAAELQGATPSQADAVAELTKLRGLRDRNH